MFFVLFILSINNACFAQVAEIWDEDIPGWTTTFANGDPIDAATDSNAYFPQIAVDSNGIVYTVFEQNFAGRRIFLSRYDGIDVEIWDNDIPGWSTTFTDGDPIDEPTSGAAQYPQIAIDQNGIVYITYQQEDSDVSNIYLNRYDGTDMRIWDNGVPEWTDTFTDGDPIDPGTQGCETPQLAVDLNGNVYVTYVHFLAESLYLNRYNGTDVRIWDNDTSSWITTFADGDSIDVGAGDSSYPQIAVDLNGVVYVTYMYYEGGQEMQKLADAGFSYSRVCLNRYGYVPEVIAGSDGNNDDKDGGGAHCYIENFTLAPDDIMLCRRFRDDNLLTNPVGQILVSAYYRISPVLVKIINNYPVLKNVAREIFRPVIWLCGKMAEEDKIVKRQSGISG